ncbi:GNAT family N-acetyltransferase [Methylocapsa palsarum]|uniref:Acetyltransferase involved in cellulose biosynthesis, CelD/BcsL family n=1 Tax=Methylocapsa palsarum TaxID=1612308 RepID=A0A1I4CV14_9HYPH|nr:GNAT family N-acetyltransferase [Methylocapsa palsarum]SFK84057.1 Acetyltransferase involved in cellulose biosynthesis, CelD/BcsL family [Methylocapsa palsarum]
MRIISDPARFEALRSDWDTLAAAAPQCYLSQTFDWCSCGWETVARSRQRKLACLVGYSGGKLVLVWPFVIGRFGPWRIAQPLGSETTEYTAPLADPGGDREDQLVAAGWDYLKARIQADVVLLPQLRTDSTLAHVLERDSHQAASARSAAYPAPFVAWDKPGDWKAYYQTLSRKLRSDSGRQRRRLAEQGKFAIETISDQDEAAVILAWMIQQKLDWVRRMSENNDWLDKPEYKAFLTGMLCRPTGAGHVEIHTLKVEGKLIAAQLSTIDRSRVEAFIAAYDPAWSQYSPSRLLLEDRLEKACEAGLQYDFRVGDEAYKDQWSNRFAELVNAYRALTLWGRIYVMGVRAEILVRRMRTKMNLQSRLARHIPREKLRRLKRALGLRSG